MLHQHYGEALSVNLYTCPALKLISSGKLCVQDQGGGCVSWRVSGGIGVGNGVSSGLAVGRTG